MAARPTVAVQSCEGLGFRIFQALQDKASSEIGCIRCPRPPYPGCNELKPNLAMGDPGLLIDRILPKVEKKYRWGIIPHVIDRDESVVRDISNGTPNSLVIDLRDPNLTGTAMAIASCDFVISSSLHGIIVADALGIPHVWTKITGKVFHADWKFSDYFMSMERSAPLPVSIVTDLRRVENVSGLSEREVVERRQTELEVAFREMNL